MSTHPGTYSANAANADKKWVTIDAKGLIVGRLASIVALRLRGKHKPTFTPHVDCGDNVIIINAEKVVLTGRKLERKVYYHHTGYIGGIKERTAKFIMEGRFPERIVEKAVERMLPRNILQHHRARKLRLYPGPEHPDFEPHQLSPYVMPPRLVRNKSGLPLDFELPPGVKPLNDAVWQKDVAQRASIRALLAQRKAAIDASIARGDVPSAQQ